MTNDRTDASGGSTAQVRVTLNPRQSVLVDAAERELRLPAAG
jgi:hypothetical protein